MTLSRPNIFILDVEDPDLANVSWIDSIAGSSEVVVLFPNPGGTKTTRFEQHDEMRLDTIPIDGSATTTRFRGPIIEQIIDEVKGTLQVRAEDYSSELKRQFPVLDQASEEISVIAQTIIDTYSTNIITTPANFTATSSTIARVFRGATAYDQIIRLADETGSKFWVTPDKEGHFSPDRISASGLSITEGIDPIVNFNFPESGRKIINRVTVFGDPTGEGGDGVRAQVESRDSQEFYGSATEPMISEELVVDKTIQTNAEAAAAATVILQDRAFAPLQGDISVIGYDDVLAGNLITLSIPSKTIFGEFLVINKKQTWPAGITTLTVAQYADQLEFTIIDLIKRMRKREQEDIDENAVSARFLNLYEDLNIGGLSTQGEEQVQVFQDNALESMVWGDPNITGWGDGIGQGSTWGERGGAIIDNEVDKIWGDRIEAVWGETIAVPNKWGEAKHDHFGELIRDL